jgi:hypothetical protein
MKSANHQHRKVAVTIETVGVDGKVRHVGSHFGVAYWAKRITVAGYRATFVGAAVGFSAVAAFAFISCHQKSPV